MSITVVVAADGYGPAPRVKVTVSSSPVVNGPLILTRVHADGTEHPLLTEAGTQLISGGWIGFDYCAPFNEAVKYRAESRGVVSALSGAAWVVSSNAWMVHPADVGLSFRIVKVMDLGVQVYGTRATRFNILGSPAPIHLSGSPRQTVTGSIEVQCESLTDVRKVMDALADDEPLLLNTPWDDRDVKWLWVQPGDVTKKNIAGMVSYPRRRISFPFEETTQPFREPVPLWTDDDWFATGWTADQSATHYASDADLQLNVRSS